MQEYNAPPEVKGKVIVAFSEGSANYCSLSDGGTIAIATSSKGYAAVIDMTNASKYMIGLFEQHESATHQCTISAFGRAAATASLDGSVQVWNTENPEQVWKRLTYKEFDRAVGVALSRDGEYLAAAFQRRSDMRGTIVVYKMPEFTEVVAWKMKELDVFSGAVAISEDGRIVAHCSTSKVYVVEVKAAIDRGASRIGTHRSWRVTGESHVSMSADGSKIVVADDKKLRIISVTGTDIFVLRGYQRSFRPFCCINAAGTRVVAAINGNKFRVWDTSGKIVADIIGFDHHTRGCSISENGNLILGCSFDRTVRIANLEKELLSAPIRIEKEEFCQVFDELNISNDALSIQDKEVPNLKKSPQVEASDSNENIQAEENPDTKECHILPEEEETPIYFAKDESMVDQSPVESEKPKTKVENHEPQVEDNKKPEEMSLSSVQLMIRNLEEMDKKNEEEQLKKRTKKITDKSISENRDKEEEEKDTTDSAACNAEALVDETDHITNSNSSSAVPISISHEIFSKALFRNERSEEGTLLHVQASEALDELFGEEALSALPKYAKDDVLLSVDSNRCWKINVLQFVEAAYKINQEIMASNTDRWTAAFTGAAETKENHLTLPQAALVINNVLNDDAPSRGDIFEALESIIANEDDVTFDSFLASVKKLGFED